jgi:hypothetical protein
MRIKSLDLFMLAVYYSFSRLKRGTMDSVKKVSSKKAQHHPSSARHKSLQKSTTLNRRFVKRPVAKAQVSKRQQLERDAFLRRKAVADRVQRENKTLVAKRTPGGVRLEPIAKVATAATATTKAVSKRVDTVKKEKVDAKPIVHPTAALANARVAARKAPAPRQLTAQEMKDRAIQQALRRVATMDKDDTAAVEEQMTEAISKKRGVWRKRKLFVALAMSAVSIALLGYLVHLNLPDWSVRVAAMQSGIESAYPSHVPRGYRMTGITADSGGRVTIEFAHGDGRSFALIQEKSSWDSAALLSQFVIPEWGNDYEIIKEQGLTIYVVGSDAAWMDGGIFYRIDDAGDGLTKQQLHDIAVSL